MKPVILDVDTGIDDALAIMLAIRHPSIDVRAITCVGGNVPLPQVVSNTLAVLEWVDAPEVIVAAGAARPLIETPADASYIHGSNGLANLEHPPHNRRAHPEHAIEVLRREIAASDEPVTIIALAPLTNIALLLRTHEDLIPEIERIVMMGGAIGQGNATAAAEFNIWHDPEAAHIVLESGVPVTMYGLEPFYRVAVAAAPIDELGASTLRHERVAGALLAHLAGVTAEEERVDGAAAIGDAGAVCAMIDPQGVTVCQAPVHVELARGLSRGATVVDLRTGLGADGNRLDEHAGRIDVVTEVDGPRYVELFLETVRGLR